MRGICVGDFNMPKKSSKKRTAAKSELFDVGVDIGGIGIKFCVRPHGGTAKGQRLYSVTTPTAPSGMIDAIRSLGTLAELDWTKVVSIGIGFPGPFGPDGSIEDAPNIGPAWRSFALASEVSAALNVSNVVVHNDAKVAGLGECVEGIGAKYTDIVGMTLGTGIGGFIIRIHEDGRVEILTGARGGAGEIGHTVIFPQVHAHVFSEMFGTKRRILADHVCGCGRSDCLEALVGAGGIDRLVNDHLRNRKSALFSDGHWRDDNVREHIRMIHEQAQEGDSLCVQIMNMQAYLLAVAAAQAEAWLQPSVIILCGGMTKSGPLFLERIRSYYTTNTCRFPKTSLGNKMPIVYGKLGERAGAVGATYLFELMKGTLRVKQAA